MSILLSVNPPYAGLLVDGEKTIEWRTKPLPEGTAYIYETKKDGGCGMVIGRVEIINTFTVDVNRVGEEAIKEGKVSRFELQKYAKGQMIGLNFCEFAKRFESPLPLSEFIHPSDGCCNEGKCRGCKWLEIGNEWIGLEDDCYADFDTDCFSPVRRPPQSWCYVDDSVLGNPGWSVPKAELHECKDCARYDECKDHVIPNETFWEVGGCKAFEKKGETK